MIHIPDGRSFSSIIIVSDSGLPCTGTESSELSNSGNVGIEAAVHGYYLAGEVAALIGSKVKTHVADILRTAVTVYHDVVQEDASQSLRNMSLVLRSYNKTRTNAVAADVLLAVLESGGLGEHVHAGFCTGVSSGTQVAAAGSHGTDVDYGAAVLILLHVGKHSLDCIESTAHIALEDRIPHLNGELIHAAILETNVGSIVYQNVDLAVFLVGVCKKRIDDLKRSHVHEVIPGLAAGIHDFINNCLTSLGSASADNYFRTLCCKKPCNSKENYSFFV